jgi:hypothetical protein
MKWPISRMSFLLGAAATPAARATARIYLLSRCDSAAWGREGSGPATGEGSRRVAEAAREHRPALKVLFITGYAENAAIANGFLAPGMEMVTKPFAVDGSPSASAI